MSAVTCIIVSCQCVSFLMLFSRFSLYLDFSSFTMMFLVVLLFAFILLRICWGSWISKLIFFTNFGKILAMMSSNTFLAHSLSFPFCYFNYMHVRLLDILPQITRMLGFYYYYYCLFGFCLFLFFVFFLLYWSLFTFISPSFCNFKSAIKPIKFKFLISNTWFPVLHFPFGPLYSFHSLCWDSPSVHLLWHIFLSANENIYNSFKRTCLLIQTSESSCSWFLFTALYLVRGSHFPVSSNVKWFYYI